jgi:hypothetical protein
MIYPLNKPRCPECQAHGFHLEHCSAHFDNRPAPSSELREVLASELDGLLDAVRDAEDNWRFDDLLDVVARREGWPPVSEPGHPN